VLHRKNALFYKTEHGAAVGDLYMSLIHTCELNKVNSFEYMTVLQRHAAKVKENPGPGSRGITTCNSHPIQREARSFII